MARPKTVCCKCSFEMVPDINGVYVVLMAWDPPQPYEIWCGDQWKCRKCGNTIVTGYAQRGIQHFEEKFPNLLEHILQTQDRQPVYMVKEQ